MCFFPFLAVAQSQEIIDSLIYSKIPFNEDSAKRDIEMGKIRVLQLISSAVITDTFLENEDFEFVEDKYGFKFYYELFDLPLTHLSVKEKEYNAIVFNYLDSVCSCDSGKSIFEDLRDRFIKKKKSP